jgi:hypothetical protein
MGIITQNCPTCSPDDICEKIRGMIHKLIFGKGGPADHAAKGLVQRIMEQIYGGYPPYDAAGNMTQQWINHNTEITKKRNQVRKLMDDEDYKNNDCGDRAPMSAEAKQWFRRGNPTPAEYKGPKPAAVTVQSQSSSGLIDWAWWEKATGLTGAALVTYLIISEGSRLFPPRNLVPVP